MTRGFQPGNLIIVAARPSVGKALALDTPLPTPHGWTTMGEVSVDMAKRLGDELATGNQVTVTACPTSKRMFERAGRPADDLISVLRRWLYP